MYFVLHYFNPLCLVVSFANVIWAPNRTAPKEPLCLADPWLLMLRIVVTIGVIHAELTPGIVLHIQETHFFVEPF